MSGCKNYSQWLYSKLTRDRVSVLMKVLHSTDFPPKWLSTSEITVLSSAVCIHAARASHAHLGGSYLSDKNGPGGPILWGDQMWRDMSPPYTTGNRINHSINYRYMTVYTIYNLNITMSVLETPKIFS